MMTYISAAEAATKWNISKRRVTELCRKGRVKNAQRAGNVWILPDDTEKPMDARIKNGKYIKKKGEDL